MTPPTILIVEDDPALRTLTARALQENGFAVKLANAAPEMWQALEVGQIDLILLDIMLPGTSGIDLCRQVRQRNAVPIIFISAKGSEVDRVVGLELGADFDLLVAFLDNAQRVVARERLIELSRARIGDSSDRSIDVLVSRLRRKLSGAGGAAPIVTVRGVGYMLNVPVERR